MSLHPEKRVIVIVEDSAPLAALIKETLNAEPEYQALEVHDGETALEIIQAVQANAVILDIGLPGRSGLQIYDALQADARTRHLPVLFVTAQAEPTALIERGIMHVIAKPFDLDVLLNHVDRLCGIDRAPPVEATHPLPPDYAMGVGAADVLLDAGNHDLATIMDFLTGRADPT